MILLSNKSEMRLHWIVTIIVYTLKILGLAPFCYRISSTSSKKSGKPRVLRVFRSSKIGTVYNILLLILYQVITVLGFPSTFSHFRRARLDNKIYVVGMVFKCLTSNVLIISCTLRQNEAISVMNRLLEVDRLLSGTENGPPYNKAIFALLVSHITFNASLWSIHIYEAANNPNNIRIKSFEIMTNFFIYWFTMEYTVVLGLIVGELRRGNNNLSKLKDHPDNLSPETFIDGFNYATKSQLDPLKLFITIRTTLYEVSRDVAELFSFPILFSVGCCFFLLTARIRQFLRDLDLIIQLPAQCVFSIAGIIIIAYPTILLTLNVSKAVCEAKLTRRIVQKLWATVKRPEIKAELQEFSLQLLHEHHTYTAYGIFTLNSEILLSVNTKRISIDFTALPIACNEIPSQ